MGRQSFPQTRAGVGVDGGGLFIGQILSGDSCDVPPVCLPLGTPPGNKERLGDFHTVISDKDSLNSYLGNPLEKRGWVIFTL